jgi:Cytochrome P460
MTHISQEDTLSDGSLSCWLELQRWPTLSPWPARHLDTPMTRPHDLRNHNSPWIPRLEVDLRGPRRRQPPQYRRRFGQRCRDLGLPQRDASVPGRHNHSRFALPSRPVGGKQQNLWPRAVLRCRSPTNIQFMVKDSAKYTATGGWRFGHFNTDGKPGAEALMKTCFP